MLVVAIVVGCLSATAPAEACDWTEHASTYAIGIMGFEYSSPSDAESACVQDSRCEAVTCLWQGRSFGACTMRSSASLRPSTYQITFVPSCSCRQVSGQPLVNRGGSGCTSWSTCPTCAGDCDSDSDCGYGLKCFQRSGKTPVPGCGAGGCGDVTDYDYCYQARCDNPYTVDGGLDYRTMYAASSVNAPATCQSQTQTRTCNAGTFSAWSGTYSNTACSVKARCYNPDTVDGGTDSRTMYAASSVNAPATCQSQTQTRTCNAGTFSTWSGTYTNTACSVKVPAPTPKPVPAPTPKPAPAPTPKPAAVTCTNGWQDNAYCGSPLNKHVFPNSENETTCFQHAANLWATDTRYRYLGWDKYQDCFAYSDAHECGVTGSRRCLLKQVDPCDGCVTGFEANGGCEAMLAGKDPKPLVPAGCDDCGYAAMQHCQVPAPTPKPVPAPTPKPAYSHDNESSGRGYTMMFVFFGIGVLVCTGFGWRYYRGNFSASAKESSSSDLQHPLMNSVAPQAPQWIAPEHKSFDSQAPQWIETGHKSSDSQAPQWIETGHAQA